MGFLVKTAGHGPQKYIFYQQAVNYPFQKPFHSIGPLMCFGGVFFVLVKYLGKKDVHALWKTGHTDASEADSKINVSQGCETDNNAFICAMNNTG